MRLRTCPCGWLHLGLPRLLAEKYVSNWNDYNDANGFGLPRATMDDYTTCYRCGGSYTEFREALPDDGPNDGTMLQPILLPEE